jgi:hypothetical protein
VTFDQDTPTDGSESGGIPTSAQGRSEASVNAGGRRTFPPASTPPAGLSGRVSGRAACALETGREPAPDPCGVTHGVDPSEGIENGDRTRGYWGPMTTVSSHIDWLSVTGRRENFDLVAAVFETWFGHVDPVYKAMGYEEVQNGQWRTHLQNGHFKNPTRWRVEIPGAALQELNSSAPEVIRTVCGLGDKITRLDCAIDVRHPAQAHTWRSMAEQLVKTARARGNFRNNHPESDGFTAYLGSEKGDDYVRLYDKGAQVGAGPGWWFRYEAQFNRKKAETMTRTLAGSEDVAELARSWAVGCIRNLPVIEPRLFRLLGENPLVARAEAECPDWDRTVEHWHHTCFGKAAMIAEHNNCSIWDVLRAAMPEEAKPTKVEGKHAGLFSSCPVGKKWYH